MDTLGAILQHRRATAGRLRRVSLAVSAWDEYDGAQTMPADLRPAVGRPTLERATRAIGGSKRMRSI